MRVESSAPNTRHYFESFLVEFGADGSIESISSQVKIHGQDARTGERSISWRDDYVAEYSMFGGCFFPASVRYYAPADTGRVRPRIEVALSYTFGR